MLTPGGDTGAWFFVVLLALVAVGRLFEVLSSRRRLQHLSPTAWSFDKSGVWPRMVVLHGALLVLPLIEVVWRGDLLVPALFWPCVALILATTSLRLWTQFVLGPAWNARGIIDPQLGFQTGGPYRWLRHPNYLAVALEVILIPLAGSAFLSLALLLPAHAMLLRRRMAAEDRAMETLPGYRDAFARRGHLLPRFSRSAAGRRTERDPILDPPRA